MVHTMVVATGLLRPAKVCPPPTPATPRIQPVAETARRLSPPVPPHIRSHRRQQASTGIPQATACGFHGTRSDLGPRHRPA